MKFNWMDARGAASSESSFIRGAAVLRMDVIDDDGEVNTWAVVMYRDTDGYWFRQGQGQGAIKVSPVFSGPYDFEAEAKAAAEIAFRMGVLE